MELSVASEVEDNKKKEQKQKQRQKQKQTKKTKLGLGKQGKSSKRSTLRGKSKREQSSLSATGVVKDDRDIKKSPAAVRTSGFGSGSTIPIGVPPSDKIWDYSKPFYFLFNVNNGQYLQWVGEKEVFAWYPPLSAGPNLIPVWQWYYSSNYSQFQIGLALNVSPASAMNPPTAVVTMPQAQNYYLTAVFNSSQQSWALALARKEFNNTLVNGNSYFNDWTWTQSGVLTPVITSSNVPSSGLSVGGYNPSNVTEYPLATLTKQNISIFAELLGETMTALDPSDPKMPVASQYVRNSRRLFNFAWGVENIAKVLVQGLSSQEILTQQAVSLSGRNTKPSATTSTKVKDKEEEKRKDKQINEKTTISLS